MEYKLQCSVLQCVAVCCSVLQCNKDLHFYNYFRSHPWCRKDHGALNTGDHRQVAALESAISTTPFFFLWKKTFSTQKCDTLSIERLTIAMSKNSSRGVATISRLLKISGLFCRISSLFYKALLQKRPVILRSLLLEATPRPNSNCSVDCGCPTHIYEWAMLYIHIWYMTHTHIWDIIYSNSSCNVHRGCPTHIY